MRLQLISAIVILSMFFLGESQTSLASQDISSTNYELFSAILKDMEQSASSKKEVEALINSPRIFSKFPSNEFLFANNANIKNLKSFPSMPKMGNLDLSSNELSSLRGLDNQYAKLEFFVIDSNLLQDFSGCPAHLEQLLSFSAANNQLASLRGITQYLPKLEVLSLDNNALRNLQFFPRLGKHIEYISLGGNKELADISPLIESLADYIREGYQELNIDLCSTAVPTSQIDLLLSLGNINVVSN